jgi:type III pantothenate kinase
MLLAIDVGNTQTVIGVYAGDTLKRHWRISTYPKKTNDEWALALSELLTINGLGLNDISGAIVCSVVPDVTQALEAMCRRTLEFDPLMVSPATDTGVTIKIDNPQEIGADRLVNAAAALAEYGGPAIIADFGTATTFDVLSAEGEYLGGAIAPGIEISLDALFSRAARISEIEITVPDKAIGRNTAEGLLSGIVFGYAGQVDALVDRIKKELAAPEDSINLIATGGLAETVLSSCRTSFTNDPLLTLKGLKLINDRNKP